MPPRRLFISHSAKEPDARKATALPPEFEPAVDRVCQARALDADAKIGDLALLGIEIEGLPWQMEGLRQVGRALFDLEALEPAAETWERIRTAVPSDVEANERLSTIDERRKDPARSDAAPRHVVLFTGHRIDDPDRPKPRFPPSLEEAARIALDEALADAATKHGPNLLGISGAASGGDILFLEACDRHGIPVQIHLALPDDAYVAQSVASSQGDWTDRFYALTARHKPRILQLTEELPPWLSPKKETYPVWERCNLWMFERATVHGGAHMTLFALWNGESGDGPGGTADLVTRATAAGARVVRLLADALQ
jgi:hypothetical protein